MDHRQQFSKWWLTEFKTIKFPNQGTIFDYYIHPEKKTFNPWDERVPEFELDPDVPLQVFPTSIVYMIGLTITAQSSPQQCMEHHQDLDW